MAFYFEKFHGEIYGEHKVFVHRLVAQVYGVDLLPTEDKAEEQKHIEEKVKPQRGRKPKSQKNEENDEEEDEIDQEVASYDLVSITAPLRARTSEISEAILLVRLIIANTHYSRVLDCDYAAVMKAYNKYQGFKDFLTRMTKTLLVIKIKLEESFFQEIVHSRVKLHIKNLLSSGILKPFASEFNTPLTNISICY